LEILSSILTSPYFNGDDALYSKADTRKPRKSSHTPIDKKDKTPRMPVRRLEIDAELYTLIFDSVRPKEENEFAVRDETL
jgi:hypothetical protein